MYTEYMNTTPLIDILTKLQKHRPLAEGFLAVVKSEYMNDQVGEFLVGYMTDVVRQINHQRQTQHLTSLSTHEEAERAQELQDIESLLSQI